jgi:hypothetical protein
VRARWQVHNTMTPLTQNTPDCGANLSLILNQFSHMYVRL